MGRALPDYNPQVDGLYLTSKRRREIFKRVYRKRDHWRALQEDHGMEQFITSPDGEDIFYGDLMVGHNTLPPQQRAAFDLICLQEYTESAATAEILPNSKWSTPVQQYSDDGLKKMIAAYDAKQEGTWDPTAVNRKKRRVRKSKVATPVPEVPDDIQDETTPKFRRVDHLNWKVCSEDNTSLAQYIEAQTGLPITGQMVKAVAFLRNPWYHSPERVAHREQVAQQKEAEKAKYAYETPQQRDKRFEAARRLRSAEAAKKRADELQTEVRRLREEAGLDPETGEPIEVS